MGNHEFWYFFLGLVTGKIAVYLWDRNLLPPIGWWGYTSNLKVEEQ